MKQQIAARVLVPLLAVIFALAAGACATKQETGAVVGAGTGAAVGSAVGDSVVGALIGGAIGAVLGSEIGRAMDRYDRQQVGYVLETAPTYQSREWVNPDTGYQYRVTPTETYRRAGQPCREFRMYAEIGYDVEEVYGTACRQPDGTWEVVSG